MADHTKRFCMLVLCMGTLGTLLFGCSKQEQMSSTHVNQETDSMIAQGDPSKKAGIIDIQFSKVSLISQEGIDVELEAGLFQEKWVEYTPYLVESSPLAMQDSYTIVGWDKQNQPHVIQVSTEGIKVGQDYYQVEKTVDNLIYWIREHIGIEYLNHLVMERMIVEARDLEIKKEMPYAVAEDVFELIKASSLVKGEPRLAEALYPAYILDVEYKKDHFLQLTVLSPTLLSIQDGQDRWFYQLNKSIFSLLKEVIPITYFSKQHIKHLFQAQAIVIIKENDTFSFNKQTNDALSLETLIHQYVRYLAKGRKMALGAEEDSFIYNVQFIFADKSVLELDVGEHVFFYEGGRYELYNIGSKIEEIITTMELHNKQKK